MPKSCILQSSWIDFHSSGIAFVGFHVHFRTCSFANVKTSNVKNRDARGRRFCLSKGGIIPRWKLRNKIPLVSEICLCSEWGMGDWNESPSHLHWSDWYVSPRARGHRRNDSFWRNWHDAKWLGTGTVWHTSKIWKECPQMKTWIMGKNPAILFQMLLPKPVARGQMYFQLFRKNPTRCQVFSSQKFPWNYLGAPFVLFLFWSQPDSLLRETVEFSAIIDGQVWICTGMQKHGANHCFVCFPTDDFCWNPIAAAGSVNVQEKHGNLNTETKCSFWSFILLRYFPFWRHLEVQLAVIFDTKISFIGRIVSRKKKPRCFRCGRGHFVWISVQPNAMLTTMFWHLNDCVFAGGAILFAISVIGSKPVLKFASATSATVIRLPLPCAKAVMLIEKLSTISVNADRENWICYCQATPINIWVPQRIVSDPLSLFGWVLLSERQMHQPVLRTLLLAFCFS